MGSILSAIHDDDHEWAILKSQAKIKSVTWDAYSIEARYAKEGFDKGLIGGYLVEYVVLRVEKDAIDSKIATLVLEQKAALEAQQKLSEYN